MKNSTIACLIKVAILVVALGGVYMCAFWYPFSLSLTVVGAPSGEFVPATGPQKLAFWSQLIFDWILSLPCFAVLLLGWQVSGHIREDNLFAAGTVRKLRLACILLLVASCIFVLGHVAFALLSWNPFALLYCFIGVMGMLLAFGLYVLAKFISKAQLLKEENESFL